MRYRVEDLAARAGVSVDTVRFYQGRGLLDAPERDGRVAWYGDSHLERLARIRDLKAKGLSLHTIALWLRDELDEVDRALVEELAAPAVDPGRRSTRSEVAERLGIPVALLEAIEREGLVTPAPGSPEPLYDASDVETIAAGLTLLDAGLPLAELLALAREHDRAARAIATRAVDAFAEFVSGPIRASAASDADAARAVVTAFRKMLPAVGDLVANHFRSALVEAARERLGVDPFGAQADETEGDAAAS